jgi:hypothetical protein
VFNYTDQIFAVQKNSHAIVLGEKLGRLGWCMIPSPSRQESSILPPFDNWVRTTRTLPELFVLSRHIRVESPAPIASFRGLRKMLKSRLKIVVLK